MRQRPKILMFLSFALIGVALAMPAQVMVIYGHKWNEMGAVMDKLTLFNWLVMWGALACAAMIWRASPHSARAMLILTSVVAFNNYFVGYYAIDYSPWAAALATVGFGFLNYPLFSPRVREVLNQPGRRWWLSAERRRMNVPVVIGVSRRTPVRAETFDLSESGVFISLRDTYLKVDDRIGLRLTFGTFSQLRCEGRVVRRGEAKGAYPAGIGVEFTGLDWRQKRELRRYLKSTSL